MVNYEEELQKELDFVGEPCISRGLIRVEFAQRLINELNSVNRRLAYRIRDIEKLKAELKIDYRELFDWLDEEASELVCETWAIADTGDYDSQWVVYEEYGKRRKAIGWGSTPDKAIQDAMKDSEDPTKYNYIPPEYR